MRATHNFSGKPEDLGLHEIRIQGLLDERWTDWLQGLKFTHESDGTTTLMGPLADQAALHRVLTKIRDLALPTVPVRRVDHSRTTTETS